MTHQHEIDRLLIKRDELERLLKEQSLRVKDYSALLYSAQRRIKEMSLLIKTNTDLFDSVEDFQNQARNILEKERLEKEVVYARKAVKESCITFRVYTEELKKVSDKLEYLIDKD